MERQEELAQDLIRLGVRMKVADIMSFVKEYYSPNLDITELTGKKDLFERLAKPPEERTNLDLFFQLEEYIKTKKGRVSPKTINIFQQIGYHLRAYEKFANIQIGFDSLTFDFYDKYTRFLTFEYVHERRKVEIKALKTIQSARP